MIISSELIASNCYSHCTISLTCQKMNVRPIELSSVEEQNVSDGMKQQL